MKGGTMLTELMAKLTGILEQHNVQDHDLKSVRRTLYGIEYALRRMYCTCYQLGDGDTGVCKYHGRATRRGWGVYAFWPDDTGRIVNQQVTYLGPSAD